MKRAVSDTNILVSAIIYSGLPLKFLRLASQHAFTPLTSVQLLDELEDVLRRKFARPPAEIDAIRARLEIEFEVVSPAISLSVIKADPDDDRVLECAVAGRADYIISGDKHLLKLGQYQGIRIVTLREFMDIVNPPA